MSEGGTLTYKGNQDASHPTPGPSGNFPVPTTSAPGSPHIWSGLKATVGPELSLSNRATFL